MTMTFEQRRNRVDYPYSGIPTFLRAPICTELDKLDADIAIMGRPPREPAVASVALGDHPHVLIARSDHALTRKRDISPAEFLAETFILREPGSGTRILL